MDIFYHTSNAALWRNYLVYGKIELWARKQPRKLEKTNQNML